MLLVIASVECRVGESEMLVEKLKAYISVVLTREKGTLYFEVCKDALTSSDGGEHFRILEGYVDQAAYEVHQAMPYRMAHLEKIRAHLVDGSAQQFESLD